MKLIVGLGNPGRAYIDSRHNIGSDVVKALAKEYGISLKRDRNTFSFCAKGEFKGHAVILAVPVTFMNLSGAAVKALVKKYKIDLDDLLVVSDDLDLDLGRLKVRPGGSSGGHNGLKSIIGSLNSQEFSRLRIGIGRPDTKIDASEYVLAAFSKKEKPAVREAIEKASACCVIWATKGLAESMGMFNKHLAPVRNCASVS